MYIILILILLSLSHTILTQNNKLFQSKEDAKSNVGSGSIRKPRKLNSFNSNKFGDDEAEAIVDVDTSSLPPKNKKTPIEKLQR